MNLQRMAALALATSLVACGGGGGDAGSNGDGTPVPVPTSKAQCPDQFVHSGSRVTVGGVLEGSSNPQKAVDGDFASFASLYAAGADSGTDLAPIHSAPGSQLDIRVTARSGVSFPAGTRVGAAAQLAGGLAAQQQITVTTYLGEVQQDSFNESPAASSSESPAVFSYATTKPYDAVQFSVRLSSPVSTERPEVKVYEICG